MAGTKQFDHDTVVDRAMMLFWRMGYGGTSIQDLEKATRLRRGSLYNAFGDKQGLFVAALKRYESTVGQERIEQLSNPDPYRAIEGFLDTLVAQMSEPSRPREPPASRVPSTSCCVAPRPKASSMLRPTHVPSLASISVSQKASLSCTRCSPTLRRCATSSGLR